MLQTDYKIKGSEEENISTGVFIESGITFPASDINATGSLLIDENQFSLIGLSGTVYVASSIVPSEKKDLIFTRLMTDDPYFLSGEIDSSTAPMPRPSKIDEEFKNILKNKSLETEDYEEDTFFNDSLLEWIEKYGKYALDSLLQYYKANLLKDTVVSEALITVGKVNSYWSYNGRLSLLTYFLQDNTAKIRYGAIVGLSYMNSHEVSPYISTALEKENIPLLKNILRSVLDQLEEAKTA